MEDIVIMAKTRELWVDNVKIIACVLVTLGHFFQSMLSADIMQSNDVYEWFNQTIYMFHVPLFFLCSGYLYQKHTKIKNIVSWRNNVIKNF